MIDLKTYPVNNTSYTAEEIRLFEANRTSGLYREDDFRYTIGDGLTINIGSGAGWFNIGVYPFSGIGVGFAGTAALTFDDPDVSLDRIDRVVVNFSASANKGVLKIKKGTPSASPSPVDRAQTSDDFDLVIYDVLIEHGNATLDESKITDQRKNSDLCGLMTDGSQINAIPRHAPTHAKGGDDEISPSSIGAAITEIYYANIVSSSDEWGGDIAPYAQSVAISGIKATDRPIVDLELTGLYITDLDIINEWGYVYRITTYDGGITVYSKKKLSTNIPISLRVVR